MIGKDRDPGQNADAETGGDGRLDAKKIGAAVGNMPAAAGGLDGMDGTIAIGATLLGDGERQWMATEVKRTPPAGDPMQRFRPRRHTAAFTGIALEQR